MSDNQPPSLDERVAKLAQIMQDAFPSVADINLNCGELFPSMNNFTRLTGTYARIKDGYEQWYRMVYLSLSIPPFHDGQIVYIEASYPDRGYSVRDGGVSAMIPFEYLEDIDAIR